MKITIEDLKRLIKEELTTALKPARKKLINLGVHASSVKHGDRIVVDGKLKTIITSARDLYKHGYTRIVFTDGTEKLYKSNFRLSRARRPEEV